MAIPEDYKELLIQDGINLMQSITKAYGPDEGIKLWEQISQVLDPSLKGAIFFSMLNGWASNKIVIYIPDKSLTSGHTVSAIKCLRTVSGMGLKEAKDTYDSMVNGNTLTVMVDPALRKQAISELRQYGIYIKN